MHQRPTPRSELTTREDYWMIFVHCMRCLRWLFGNCLPINMPLPIDSALLAPVFSPLHSWQTRFLPRRREVLLTMLSVPPLRSFECTHRPEVLCDSCRQIDSGYLIRRSGSTQGDASGNSQVREIQISPSEESNCPICQLIVQTVGDMPRLFAKQMPHEHNDLSLQPCLGRGHILPSLLILPNVGRPCSTGPIPYTCRSQCRSFHEGSTTTLQLCIIKHHRRHPKTRIFSTVRLIYTLLMFSKYTQTCLISTRRGS